MARIDLPDDAVIDTLPPDLQQAARSGSMINVFRTLLRSPAITIPVVQLGSAQFAAGSLPPADRELAILAAGACFHAPYETAQHKPISRAVGVTDDQRAAIAQQHWTAPCFPPAQQALLAFVAAVAADPTVDDTILDAMCNHYSDTQVVETVVLVGYYFLIARVTTVLDVPIDPPADDRVLNAGIALHQHH